MNQIAFPVFGDALSHKNFCIILLDPIIDSLVPHPPPSPQQNGHYVTSICGWLVLKDQG